MTIKKRLIFLVAKKNKILRSTNRENFQGIRCPVNALFKGGLCSALSGYHLIVRRLS